MWPRRIEFKDIESLFKIEPRSYGEGMARGFGTGLFAGAFLGIAIGLMVGDDDQCSDCFTLDRSESAIVLGLLGATVGGLVVPSVVACPEAMKNASISISPVLWQGSRSAHDGYGSR